MEGKNRKRSNNQTKYAEREGRKGARQGRSRRRGRGRREGEEGEDRK